MSAAARRVLVVDDDEGIVEFVAEILLDEGYEVLTAADGAEALAEAAQAPPGLILLDMRMPVMDGWEFTSAYRAQPGPKAPIIVMTAARDARTIAEEIHADGYLAKPFSLNTLLSLVEDKIRPQ